MGARSVPRPLVRREPFLAQGNVSYPVAVEIPLACPCVYDRVELGAVTLGFRNELL